jgi:hypothetical protein
MEKYKWTKEGELKPYFIVRKDLTVHESIILKGRKLVIPRKLRQRHNTQIVQYFHGHFRMIQLPVNAIRCQLRLNDLVNI